MPKSATLCSTCGSDQSFLLGNLKRFAPLSLLVSIFLVALSFIGWWQSSSEAAKAETALKEIRRLEKDVRSGSEFINSQLLELAGLMKHATETLSRSDAQNRRRMVTLLIHDLGPTCIDPSKYSNDQVALSCRSQIGFLALLAQENLIDVALHPQGKLKACEGAIELLLHVMEIRIDSVEQLESTTISDCEQVISEAGGQMADGFDVIKSLRGRR